MTLYAVGRRNETAWLLVRVSAHALVSWTKESLRALLLAGEPYGANTWLTAEPSYAWCTDDLEFATAVALAFDGAVLVIGSDHKVQLYEPSST